MKCDGKRYLDEILIVHHRGYSIADLLTLEIGEIDVGKLVNVIDKLTAKGATVIVIEQNPLIRQADYLIEMGPVGGDPGGYVLRKAGKKSIIHIPVTANKAFNMGYLSCLYFREQMPWKSASVIQ